MLRKLRKLEALADNRPDPGNRPSFFQSSITSHVDDRASTLRKIDEIEAQMSMQWWKTKNQTAPGVKSEPQAPQAWQPDAPGPAPMAPPEPLTYQPTIPVGLDTVNAAAAPGNEALLGDLLEGLSPSQRAAPAKPSGPDRPGNARALASRSFTNSRPMPSAQREPVVHDAELEEAAILFANGDDAGAEAGLREMLAPGAPRADHVYTWLTLFDLYRAIGAQDRFEDAALEFAQRFNRSAPQWFSLPEMVKALARPAADKPGPDMAANWICPSVLSVQSVGVLNTALARVPMPWRLDWSNLKTIEASALEPLLKVFGDWASQPVQLRFMDDAQLQKVLLQATPSGERATDQKWWLLRMQALRVIHRPDDFELTALDFCVTYEVSPPAWEVARCDYKSLDQYGDAMGRSTIIGAPSSEPVYSSLMDFGDDPGLDFAASSQSTRFLSVELSGQIEGDAVAVLDRLEASLAGADKMQISCAKLIRVDFSAAGMLLNWVAARQAENRFVEFSEVNRLVAAFFNVIGIVEYARVVARKD
jgi:ABC-type transporter Mla MlaB component